MSRVTREELADYAPGECADRCPDPFAEHHETSWHVYMWEALTQSWRAAHKSAQSALDAAVELALSVHSDGILEAMAKVAELNLSIPYLYVILFAVIVFLLGIMASESSRRWWARLATLGLMMVAFASSVLAYSDLLSRPKPTSLEWIRVEHGQILGNFNMPDIGIFVYLLLPGHEEPRSYKIPWDKDLAKQIEDAVREGQKNGTGAALKMPFEPSWSEDPPMPYAIPQPKLPLKEDEVQKEEGTSA